MLKTFLRKIKFLKLLFENNNSNNNKVNSDPLITKNLEKNFQTFKEKLGYSSDIVMRKFIIGSEPGTEAALIYIDGLVNKNRINDYILKPLMIDSRLVENNGSKLQKNILEIIESSTIVSSDIKRSNNLNYIINSVLSGDTAIIIDNSKESLLIDTRGFETRGIQPPQTEVVIRGPREGFTEILRTNTSLIRRKIHNPNLVFDSITLGEQTNTEICIAYIKGLASDKLINEIKKRLKRIKTDAILESGYIEEFIEDAPLSPFSTIANTERPDTAAAKILEGRAAILVDGTPFVLTVPMLFVESLQVSEDYYSRPFYSSIIRWIRIIALLFSILSPAVFVAITTYHQELIPTQLLITMIAAAEGTPFPAVFAALLMGLIFEILREAGIRLPRAVGQAVSIVGALVIGEATVSAGFISAPMIIIVAITAISTFVVSAQTDVATILRLVLVILAGCLGAFGVMIGLLGTLIHIVSLRSFGTPYFAPIAPLRFSELKDVLIRSPLWSMFTRPRSISGKNPQRQKNRIIPHPPEEKNNSQKKEEKGNE